MDLSAIAKPLLLELLKDPEIQTQIQGLKDSDNKEFKEADAIATYNALVDWMDQNATDIINKYIEDNGNIEDNVNEMISNGDWDITFSG